VIAAAILRRGLLHPERLALVDDLGPLTYGDLRQRILTTAAGLTHLGLRSGDRLGLVLGNRRHHIEAVLAASWLGLMAVPIDPAASGLEVRRMAERFRLQALLAEDRELWGFREVRELEALAGRIVVATPGAAGRLFPEADATSVERLSPPASPDGVFSLSLTSGSTGEPKAIVLTNEMMLYRFMSQIVEFGFSAGDRFLLSTPIHYGAGRSYALNHLFVGGAVYLKERLAPWEIGQVMVDSAITTAFLVPTQLVRMLEEGVPGGGGPVAPSLRCLLVSGAALDAAVRERVLLAITPNLYEVFASTEVGAISVIGPTERAEAGAEDASGVPLWNLEVRLRGQNQRKTGAVICRGPGVFQGYLDERPRRTAWRATGDLARWDDRGRLRWMGRASDVIVTGGRKVMPAEVEGVLTLCPGVREAAVVGVRDPVWGEAVVAFVVGDAGVSEAALRRFCQQRLSPYKVPKSFYLLAALPILPSGKVDRRRLQQSSEERRVMMAGPPGSGPPTS
jgi:acyl-CoA synthetase (AMP-forming)/AMP-acid ligase II